eukprot:COSAG05_NODE_21_length_32397_cov_125.224008_3_plen_111_part_00
MWILDHELSDSCATEYYYRGRYHTITQYTSLFPLLRLARAHVPRQIILLRRRVVAAGYGAFVRLLTSHPCACACAASDDPCGQAENDMESEAWTSDDGPPPKGSTLGRRP